MMLLLNDVLSAAEARDLRPRLERVQFADGAKTAGVYARTVKRNEQAEGGPETQKLQEQITAGLFRHPQFEMAARPRNMKPILFSRYEPGMEYGTHVDNALMSGRPPVRSDLSFTIFLADPDSYDGGELVIESPAGDMSFKLPAGSGILYPSSSLHHVAAVTRGSRLAAVSWGPELRARPGAARAALRSRDRAPIPVRARRQVARVDLVSKTFANLLRMWVET